MGAAAPKPPLAIPHNKLWGFPAFSRKIECKGMEPILC